MLVKLTTSVDFESRENKGKESKFRRAPLLEFLGQNVIKN